MSSRLEISQRTIFSTKRIWARLNTYYNKTTEKSLYTSAVRASMPMPRPEAVDNRRTIWVCSSASSFVCCHSNRLNSSSERTSNRRRRRSMSANSVANVLPVSNTFFVPFYINAQHTHTLTTNLPINYFVMIHLLDNNCTQVVSKERWIGFVRLKF